jgi:hypothetical protein
MGDPLALYSRPYHLVKSPGGSLITVQDIGMRRCDMSAHSIGSADCRSVGSKARYDVLMGYTIGLSHLCIACLSSTCKPPIASPIPSHQHIFVPRRVSKCAASHVHTMNYAMCFEATSACGPGANTDFLAVVTCYKRHGKETQTRS